MHFMHKKDLFYLERNKKCRSVGIDIKKYTFIFLVASTPHK